VLSEVSSPQHVDRDSFRQQLNIEKQDVEGILIELILDGKVKGKIDQQNGRVELERLSVASPRITHSNRTS
jgi:COP9 signalosome complex subunit 2